MAKASFKIRGNSDKETAIYLRLFQGKEYDIQVKTGFTIQPKDWDDKLKFPLNRRGSEKAKFLRANLTKLDAFLQEQINLTSNDNLTINKDWLENQIAICFSRVTKEEKEIDNTLKTHIQYIIDTASTRKVKGKNQIGLSERRVAGYKTFLSLIELYEHHLSTTIDLKDISKPFVTKFTNWLLSEKGYSTNYAGKTIDNLKTVCVDADSMEKEVNSYYKHIDSFSESKEERNIVTLSFEELKQIKETELQKDYLINVRKWLLLGCEIGQRQSDLLTLTSDHLRFENGNYFFDIKQDKTKKDVTTIVIDDYIINFLETDFPRAITSQKFNLYVKELCKACEINQLIAGSKLKTFKEVNPITKKEESQRRKEKGIYLKYELITSHICRRSFATNYYKKMPTPILMSITGHSKEAQFLDYIGKEKDKDENALMFKKFYEQIHEPKQPILRVAK